MTPASPCQPRPGHSVRGLRPPGRRQTHSTQLRAGVQSTSLKSWVPIQGATDTILPVFLDSKKHPGNPQRGPGVRLDSHTQKLRGALPHEALQLAWSCSVTSARIALCQAQSQAGCMLDPSGTRTAVLTRKANGISTCLRSANRNSICPLPGVLTSGDRAFFLWG